mmetsp:Transcript_39930/g.109885  ORF Transcript_39930/g.109885 Transcript_39930/m.109885 type:complete len:313 (+) Transcript_39930:3-941(+)
MDGLNWFGLTLASLSLARSKSSKECQGLCSCSDLVEDVRRHAPAPKAPLEGAIGPPEVAEALLDVVDVLPRILLPGLPRALAESVLLVVGPRAVEDAAVGAVKLAPAVHHALLPRPDVPRAIMPMVHSDAVLGPVKELTLEFGAVVPDLDAHALLQVVPPLATVDAVVVDGGAHAVRVVLLPLAGVRRLAATIVEAPAAMRPVVPPLARIGSAIWPLLDTMAIASVPPPLARVGGPRAVDECRTVLLQNRALSVRARSALAVEIRLHSAGCIFLIIDVRIVFLLGAHLRLETTHVIRCPLGLVGLLAVWRLP